MKAVICLIALAAVALAQDDPGAKIFRQTCAQGYCHGAGGTQGRAPKLIGRGYDAMAAQKIIRDGVPGTGMPGFKDRLSGDELTAVLAYVVKISGGDMSKLAAAGAQTAAAAMPPAARRGRELFFDATRGVNRCGTCHALDGLGIAIGPNLISGKKYTAAAIQKGTGGGPRLAIVNGERFPALLVERSATATRVYDLGAMPPPLRTFSSTDISFGPSPEWSHASVIRNYSAADLEAVAAWLEHLNRP